uniref:Major facilitator superfamily (MFS) profile domain-containing protein n=1 Tax=Plectus sambesii TaxID=2011161 RepID=A0A914XVQ0_9BILA
MPTLLTDTGEKNPNVSLPETPFKWPVAEAKTFIFAHRTRYVILALGAICISALLSNTIAFNFTVICMTESPLTIVNTSLANDSSLAIDFIALRPRYPGGKFNYSSAEKSMLFSVLAIGALVFVFPSTWLMKRFGARKIFAAILFVSGAATGLAPAAAHLGLPYFVVTRVLQGAGMAAFMPIVGTITTNWASLKQNGVFVSILTGFLPFMTMLSGELCASSAGWPAVYYVHATITLVLCAVWYGFYRDTPGSHPCVSNIELEKISRGKATHSLSQKNNSKMAVPYKAIFMTPAVWAIWVATLGNYYAGQLVIVYMPTFFNNILGYSIEDASRYAVLGCLIQLFVKLTSGLASDKIRFLSGTNKLRLFNTLALGSCGVLFVALSFIPFSHSALCVIALT